MKSRTFSAGTVEKKGNVLKITYQKDSEITVDDMKEITAFREDVFGDNHYTSLIDLREEKLKFHDDAMKYVTHDKKIKELRVAEVLLVKNFAHKMGVHLYVKVFRSKDNITVMTDEENAIHWLNRQFDKFIEEVVDA